MKILVLGGTGFIGSNLINTLQHGPKQYEITVLGRSQVNVPINKEFRLIQGDFRDTVLLRELIRGQDLIYHLISGTLPFNSMEYPLKEVELNLIPAIEFIELCAQESSGKIVFISSAGTVYGGSGDRLTELHPTQPYVPYGIIKLTTEHFLRHAHEQYGLNSYILRVSNVFGPGQDISKGLGFINAVLEALHDRRPIWIYGDGGNERDYLYVKDLCSLLAPTSLKSIAANEVYNFVSGTSYSQLEIIDLIGRITGCQPDIRFTEKRISDIKSVRLDNSKLQKDLPGFIFTPLSRALEETLNHIQHRYLLK